MPRIDGQLPRRYLLILGIVHTGIMYQLLYSAIQKLPTPVTGSLSFIYPLVAMVVDYLVFHHALSAVQLLGGMLILFAAAGIISAGAKNPAAAGSVSSRGPVSDGRGQSGICASGIRPARSRYEPDGRTGTAGTGSCPAPVNAENKRHAIQML